MEEKLRLSLHTTALVFITIGVFVLLFTRLLNAPLLFASFASSIFTIFALPKSHSAETKVILSSQLIAALSGYGMTFLFPEFSPLSAALAVGIASFFMILLHVRHPPAAGTALSFSYNLGGGGSTELFLTALVMILALGLVKAAWHLGQKLFEETKEEIEDLEDFVRKHK